MGDLKSLIGSYMGDLDVVDKWAVLSDEHPRLSGDGGVGSAADDGRVVHDVALGVGVGVGGREGRLEDVARDARPDAAAEGQLRRLPPVHHAQRHAAARQEAQVGARHRHRRGHLVQLAVGAAHPERLLQHHVLVILRLETDIHGHVRGLVRAEHPVEVHGHVDWRVGRGRRHDRHAPGAVHQSACRRSRRKSYTIRRRQI